MIEHALLNALLDPRVAIPVVRVREGRITSWNAAARDLLDGRVGDAVTGLFDAASQAKLATVLGDAPASCEVQARQVHVEPVAVRVAAVPIGPAEHVLLVSGMGAGYSTPMAQQLLAANDHLANAMRELSRQTAELEAARSRFETLANIREHFVSMLAHDVRGALHGILLNTSVMESAVERGSSEQLHKAIERIRRSSTHIRDLVENVLEAARTEVGQIVLDVHPISLRVIAHEILEIYASNAQGAGVSLAFVDRAGGAIVSGDRVRLGQVFGNLVENALRHSPAGGTVTLELHETPQFVRLEVRDQGPGIPSELREQFFERFARGSGTTKGSLGLGLYVARQLVDLHGGTIRVEEVAPHGAALVVELPRAG